MEALVTKTINMSLQVTGILKDFIQMVYFSSIPTWNIYIYARLKADQFCRDHDIDFFLHILPTLPADGV